MNRQQHEQRIAELTDALQQAEGRIAQQRAANQALAEDIAKLREILDWYNARGTRHG